MTELLPLDTEAASLEFPPLATTDPDELVVLMPSKVLFFDPVVPTVPWLPVDTVDPTVSIVAEGDNSPTCNFLRPFLSSCPSDCLLGETSVSSTIPLLPASFSDVLVAPSLSLGVLGAAEAAASFSLFVVPLFESASVGRAAAAGGGGPYP